MKGSVAIFGLQAGDDFTYEDALDRIHSMDRERVRAAVIAATRPNDPEPYAIEYRVVHPDGSIHWVFAKGRPNFGKNQVLLSFDGTIANVTARKESEERLRFVMDSMPQKVFTATPSGEVDYLNPHWLEFSGLTFQDIKGWGWTQLIHPEDIPANLAAWRHSLHSGEPFQMEHRFRRHDREYRWHISRALPMRDEGGKIVMWIGADTEIHEIKVLQEELRTIAANLSEADRRKTEFMATLGHELRNPLAPIRTGLEVMRLAKDDPATLERIRSMMERQVLHMVRLIDDLLDVSRIAKGKLELRIGRVALADVIRSAVEANEPFIAESGHRLSVVFPDEPVLVDADPHRLAQVLSNLLSNSIKYTPRGGEIAVLAECQNGNVVVTVKDNGLGIPAEMQERIFDMFAQIQHPTELGYMGLGIGLTLVKSLVQLHGGTVEVQSEGANQGSAFSFRLPIALETGSQPVQFTPPPLPPASQIVRRVLIVDDNRDGAELQSIVVKTLGHEVALAYDGSEAIRMAEEFKPDVILMDLGMPKLNGYEAARVIKDREWGHAITLVALTGWTQDEDRQRAEEAGFSHFLIKPAEPATLKNLFAELDCRPV